MTSCKYCYESITLDSGHVSESGKKIPLDDDSGEPHNCTARVSTVECNKCGEEIQFSRSRLSKNGKMIPLNMDFNAHQCDPYFIPCRICKKDITFVDDWTSESGKDTIGVR
jgi:hypothetical protein